MANCSTIMVLLLQTRIVHHALYDDPLPAKVEADNSVELRVQPSLSENE